MSKTEHQSESCTEETEHMIEGRELSVAQR